MPSVKHNESFIIRSYEVDGSGSVTLPRIADYFQEAAGKNAHDLNFDISHLQEKGATWVLFRLHIKIDDFPLRWENITVNTWPSSGDGVRAFRDYELVNREGQRLGKGVSQWMVLNIKNRRPMRMPKEVIEMGLDFEHHLLPVDKVPFEKMKNHDFQTDLEVSRFDIDMNNHVNNVKYIEWMTGYLPAKVIGKLTCHEIKIQYHKETSPGVKISIKSKSVGNDTFLHNIVDDSGNLLAEGISFWKI